MSRSFVGIGTDEPGGCEVYIEQGATRGRLRHSVSGSNAGFRWDGSGSGSTDLARALLWEATGVEPEWRIYRLFKNEVVATWPMRVGECWRISDDQIRQWLATAERDLAVEENASRTEARLDLMQNRERRLKNLNGTFGKRTAR